MELGTAAEQSGRPGRTAASAGAQHPRSWSASSIAGMPAAKDTARGCRNPWRCSLARAVCSSLARRACFLAAVEHRFRGAFGKAHVVLKDERVVLAVTGGGASRCERGGTRPREAAWGGLDLAASDHLAPRRGPQGID